MGSMIIPALRISCSKKFGREVKRYSGTKMLSELKNHQD
jgi:hypothetical protein